MKTLEKRNVRSSVVTLISLALTSIMTLVMFISVAKAMTANSNGAITSVTIGRTSAITGTFDYANRNLNSFGNNSIVRNLLKDPDNAEYLAAAQKYTEDFSNTIDNVEGIYIANWDTKVLTHTNKNTVGMVTRPKDKNPEQYAALTNAMLHSPNHLYTTGIIVSPASDKYVYSAYMAVYDEGVDPSSKSAQPLGYVGIGVYADNILKQLPDPSIDNVKDWAYCIVNTDSNTIMASTDENKFEIGAQLDNNTIKNVLEQNKNEMGMKANITKYKTDKRHTSGVVSFNAYKTCVILETDSSELYKSTRNVTLYIIIFSITILTVFITTITITRRQEKFRIAMNQEQIKNEQTERSLNAAVFSDILTGTNNRTKFAIAATDAHCKPNETFMFGMVSIVGLANINTQYGNDAGDTVITDVAKACTDTFKEADVYRTGSSEFIIVQRCNRNGNEIEQFLNKLNALNIKLNNNPHRIPGGGTIMYPCRTIAANKSDNINTSVITVMKSAILNNGNPTGYSSQLINLDA